MQVIDYIKSINFALSQGSQFMWDCYGCNAWYLEAENSSAVIDRKTGTVYEVAAFNEENDDCYKWINPAYIDSYIKESIDRGFDPWQAWDDVVYKQVNDQEILAIIAKNS